MVIKERANIVLDGVVGNDPQLKTFGEFQVTEFSVARNKSYKDKFGEWQKQTSWYACKALGYNAKRAIDYIRKGQHISISGELNIEEYVNSTGVKVTKPVLTIDTFFTFDVVDDKSFADTAEDNFQTSSIPKASQRNSDDQRYDNVPF